MEELTGFGIRKLPTHQSNNTKLSTQKKKIHQKKIEQIIVKEYEDPSSPAFAKTSSTVRKVLLKKYPALMNGVSDRLVRKVLEEQSTTYSRTRVVKKNKFFFGTSFYSNHPHYRWHVDLQDMSIFKKSKLSNHFNFMLICADDFSNYIMVRLLRDKKATTVHKAIVDIIKTEKSIPTLMYCDQGSEFKNKLFDNPHENGFKVQFTIDRRKAVYAERAIRTIRRGLEQVYLLQPSTDIQTAMNQVINSHNNSPS